MYNNTVSCLKIMEKLKEKTEFSNPKFYLEVFQGCLGNGEEDKRVYDTDWLTIISSYSQTMRGEIGSLINDETKEEINAFVTFSLSLQERIESRNNCIDIKNKEKVYNIPEEDVDLSKEYLKKMILTLEEL